MPVPDTAASTPKKVADCGEVVPRQGRSAGVDDVFAALTTPTRRGMLDLLLDRPRPAEAIAAHFDMARPSVSEHLKVLCHARA